MVFLLPDSGKKVILENLIYFTIGNSHNSIAGPDDTVYQFTYEAVNLELMNLGTIISFKGEGTTIMTLGINFNKNNILCI